MESLKLEGIDEAAFRWVNGLVGAVGPLDRLMELVVSDYFVPVTLTLVLFSMWFVGRDLETRQKYQLGVFAAVLAVVIANIPIEILNNFYFRDRPFVNNEVALLFYEPTDSSFPANSAAAAFAISGTLWLLNRRVGTAMLALSAIFAFSRVYVGVHYPLDVIGGGLIGLASVFVAFMLTLALRPVLLVGLRVARKFLIA